MCKDVLMIRRKNNPNIYLKTLWGYSDTNTINIIENQFL